MPRIPALRLWPIALLAVITAAQAQAPAPARNNKDNPLDPAARVAPLVHESALAGYRRHADVAPVPWREANDTVTRIGGWRVYAREAAEPSGAASAPPPTAPSGARAPSPK